MTPGRYRSRHVELLDEARRGEPGAQGGPRGPLRRRSRDDAFSISNPPSAIATSAGGVTAASWKRSFTSFQARRPM